MDLQQAKNKSKSGKLMTPLYMTKFMFGNPSTIDFKTKINYGEKFL